MDLSRIDESDMFQALHGWMKRFLSTTFQEAIRSPYLMGWGLRSINASKPRVGAWLAVEYKEPAWRKMMQRICWPPVGTGS